MVYESSLLCTLPSGILPNGAVLNESSGMVDSRLHPQVFWTHEDSEASSTPNNFFYAIGYDGTLKKIIRLTGITFVAGGPPLYGQWEDCAYDPSTSSIWVANSGNSALNRPEFWAYRFSEPASLDSSSTVLDVPITGQYRFAFEDGGTTGWDCETMLIAPNGRLFFVNKASAAQTGLYRAPSVLSTTAVNVLTKVASWTSQANITGGDWAADNSAIYVSAGNLRGFKYAAAAPFNLIEEFVLPDPVASGNPESLCVNRNSRWLFRTSEGEGAEVQQVALAIQPADQVTKIDWWISATERLDFTPAEAVQPVAVPGGSFESAGDLAMWTKTGGPANILTREQSPLSPVHGAWYGLLEIQSAGTTHNLDSDPIDITDVIDIPELPAWVYWKTGGPYFVRVDYRFFSDAAGTVGLTPATYTGTGVATSTTEWTEVLHPSMPKPAGAVSMRLRVAALGSPALGTQVALDGIGVPGLTAPGGGEETVEQERARLRTEIMAPVNATDAAVQSGDLSGFTRVTTFTALRDLIRTGGKALVDTTILCPSQLLVTTGSAIYVTSTGKVLRDYASSGATTQALIRTAQVTGGTGYYNEIVPSHDMYFGGPGEIGSSSTANTGNIFSIGGDNIVMDGFTTRQWNGGRHTCWVGDNGRARRVRFLGGQAAGSGNGGLRYMGGVGFRAIDSQCDSGDDVWQCVPAGALADPFFSVSIDDCIYFNCTGSSYSGRVCIVGNQDQYDDGVARMNCSVSNVQFIDVQGGSSGAAMAIQNKSSSGIIGPITYKRVTITGITPSVGGQPGAVFLNNVNGMGGVQDVTYIDVHVDDHHRPGIRNGPGTQALLQRIKFIRGRFERGTEAPSEPVVEITGGSDWSMEEVILDRRGSSSTVVVDQADDAPSSLDYTVVN